MAFKVIVPAIRGLNRKVKGLSIYVSAKGRISLSDDLIKDMKLTSHSGVAFFIDTDTNRLALQATSVDNPMSRPFVPKRKNVTAYVFNAGVYREGAQVGRWNVTSKEGDIYLTDCPVISPEKVSVKGKAEGVRITRGENGEAVYSPF